LPDAPRPADAADALALALCHLWRSPMQARLAAARPVAMPGAGAGAAAVASRTAR
jgi:crossover junction endodeoxyribonuclease RuvC